MSRDLVGLEPLQRRDPWRKLWEQPDLREIPANKTEAALFAFLGVQALVSGVRREG